MEIKNKPLTNTDKGRIALNTDNNKLHIIIADDSKVIRRTLIKHLAEDFNIHECEDGQQAWDELQNNTSFKLLITDLTMPNMDGYQLIRSIRNSDNKQLKSIPILVITGKDDKVAEKEYVVSLGATDLIGKPFDKAELQSRTRSYSGLNARLTELERQSPLDPLTGLVNKDHFIEQGKKTFSMSQRHGHELTVVRLKMQNYHQLSEQFSQRIANSVIKQVANLLKQSLRAEDLAAYCPIDEFALLLHYTDSSEAENVIKRISQKIENLKMRILDQVVTIPFASGIATESITPEFNSFNQLLEHAESALKQADEKGTGHTVHYQTEQGAQSEPETTAEKQTDNDINIEELLTKISTNPNDISHSDLEQAVRKLLPLMEQANEVVKLGLGKMIPYLKRKLG